MLRLSHFSPETGARVFRGYVDTISNERAHGIDVVGLAFLVTLLIFSPHARMSQSGW